MRWPAERTLAGAQYSEILRQFENLSADDQYAILTDLYGAALDSAAETFLSEATEWDS